MLARRVLSRSEAPKLVFVASRPLTTSYPRLLPSLQAKRGRDLPRKRFPALLHRPLSTSAAVRGKLQPFLLADIGEGITEVQVCAWSVKEGAKVEEFDAICEVQSDKATVDITSRYKGHVRKLYAKEGDVIRVGQPLCDIELDDDSPAPAPEDSAPPSGARASPAEPQPSTSAPVAEAPVESSRKREVLATPAIRRIARETRIDLANVRGTGKDGRVLREDILAHVEGAPAAATPTPAAPAPPPGQTTTVPLTSIRRAMFKAMAASLQIPHFAYSEEIDVTELDRLRIALNEAIPTRYRKTLHPKESEPADRVEESLRFDRITLLPLLLKALSRVLDRHPLFLSTLSTAGDAPQLQQRSSHDISIALSAPAGGLYTPIIPSVDTLSPYEIASRIAQLQSFVSGPTPRLPPSVLKPGTITLSNVGVIGGTNTHPVIPPTGQLAIGALGRVAVKPRYPDEAEARAAARAGLPLATVPRLILPVSFTADHRVVEGVESARLVEDWRRVVEKPMLLIGEGR